jgi:hypothetical protein
MLKLIVSLRKRLLVTVAKKAMFDRRDINSLISASCFQISMKLHGIKKGESNLLITFPLK